MLPLIFLAVNVAIAGMTGRPENQVRKETWDSVGGSGTLEARVSREMLVQGEFLVFQGGKADKAVWGVPARQESKVQWASSARQGLGVRSGHLGATVTLRRAQPDNAEPQVCPVLGGAEARLGRWDALVLKGRRDREVSRGGPGEMAVAFQERMDNRDALALLAHLAHLAHQGNQDPAVRGVAQGRRARLEATAVSGLAATGTARVPRLCCELLLPPHQLFSGTRARLASQELRPGWQLVQLGH
mmetsp:Transcript_18304/g.43037  ORF Transcript_18304/g.43037 Transcript_18304/m.43037 type:complete len:244 (+) Transcript_18304:433-1164(+)